MSLRRPALLASIVLLLVGAGAGHGVARVVGQVRWYSAHEWRLLLRGDEQMRIKGALGERAYGWYRAVADARRGETQLFTFFGLSRREIERYENDPDSIPPELTDHLLATYKLRRLLFPTLVHALGSDEAAPLGPALVLDLSGRAGVPFPGRERASEVGVGQDYVLQRVAGR